MSIEAYKVMLALATVALFASMFVTTYWKSRARRAEDLLEDLAKEIDGGSFGPDQAKRVIEWIKELAEKTR